MLRPLNAQVMVALDPNGRAAMKRDMELIRAILLNVQARADLEPRSVQIDGADPMTVGRHVEMLHAVGFLEGYDASHIESPIPTILVTDLSWEGHEFIAALQNDTVWSQIKSMAAGEMGKLPLSVVKDAAVALARRWAFGQLGLDGG